MKSLSDDFIVNIFELPDHKLYLETREPQMFMILKHKPLSGTRTGYLKKLNIGAKKIREILKDNQGNFGSTRLRRVYLSTAASKKTTVHYKCNGSGLNPYLQVLSLPFRKTPKGHIWVIHRDKTIEMLG